MTDDIQRIWTRLAAIEEVGVSRDGYVEVTVDACGALQSLELDPRIYRTVDADALAAEIRYAIDEATWQARRRAFDAVTPLLPGNATFEDADLPFDPLLHHLGAGTRRTGC